MSLGHLIRKVALQPPSHKKKHDYVFGDTLGAGGFGIVRRARQRSSGKEVAIKIMLKSKIKPMDQNNNDIYQELHMLEGLDHPHIVKLIDWFESREKIYVVTELCTGGELFDRICNRGQFTETDAAHCTRDIASAIHHLHHRNIVHRDVKPENLLYATTDEHSSLKLCDFGVAQSLVDPDDRITSAAGSLGYAAPEVFHREWGHGKPCDVWSLGVVLFTMLSGYSLFQADTVDAFLFEVQPGFKVQFPPEYWSNISDMAKDLITKMIEFDPEKRLTIDQVLDHPWLSAKLPQLDLLPTIKEGLSARQRWRLAYERIRLAQQVKNLGMEDEGSDDAHLFDSSSTGTPSGDRFMNIVAEAHRQNLINTAQQVNDTDTTE